MNTREISIFSNISRLEDLANEIIYKIFGFLDMYHIWLAFSKLNNRFRHLVNNSSLTLNINIPFLSKSNFESYLTQFFLPNSNRIRFLRLWNSKMIDSIFPNIEHAKKFAELKTLILDNIISKNCIKQLTFLPNLSSLIIYQSNGEIGEIISFDSIIRFPALKYCKISGRIFCEYSLRTVNEFSSIEHLVIDSELDVNRLSKMLPHLPQLRRLSVNYLCYWSAFGQTNSFLLTTDLQKLTHLSLIVKDIPFHQFRLFFKSFSCHLQILRISITNDRDYLDANLWEQFVTSHLPYLRIFDLQYVYNTSNAEDQIVYDVLIKQFSTSFWLEHKWFFGHQHYQNGQSVHGMIYSIQPYVDNKKVSYFSRRRCHTLHGKMNQEQPIPNQCHLVRQIDIPNRLTVRDCGVFFPNASELIISDNDFRSEIFIFNHILPLERLQRLTINSHRFQLITLNYLLYFLPNCSQFILNAEWLDDSNLVSQRHDPIFQSVCNTNKITHAIINTKVTFKQILLFIEICPQIECLNLRIFHQEITKTIQCLLAKSNKHTHHLVSLQLQSTADIYVEKLMNLLGCLKSLNDFTIQEINYKNCHIWCSKNQFN